MKTLKLFKQIILELAASWRKRLGARLPPLGSRVRVSVPLCGFRGGRNGVWVGFSRDFSRFPLPQISFHHFSTLISSISFHFISPCDGASGVVGRHPCYSWTYNIGASSHLIPRPDLELDTSWGYLFICGVHNTDHFTIKVFHLWCFVLIKFNLQTYNSFFLYANLYRRCSKWPPWAVMQASDRRITDSLTLSHVPGVCRICWHPCSIRWRRIFTLWIGVEYTMAFKWPHK